MKRIIVLSTILGVVLLLLGAGAVLARIGPTVEMSAECVECDERMWGYGSGWGSSESITLTVEAPVFTQTFPFSATVDGTFTVGVLIGCGSDEGSIQWEGAAQQDVEISRELEDLYGEWMWEFEGETSGIVRTTYLFADDCFAAMHVPEPGTIVLLGSGLAGLAGYASLRLRARRKREE